MSNGSTRAVTAAVEARPQRSTRTSFQPAARARRTDDGSDEECEFGDDSDDDDSDDDDDDYAGGRGSGRRTSKRGKAGASSASALASAPSTSAAGRPLRNRSVHEAQSQPAARSSGRVRQATRSLADEDTEEDDEDAEGKENGFRRSARARQPVKTYTDEEGEDDDDDDFGRGHQRPKGKKRDRAALSAAAEAKEVDVGAAARPQHRIDPSVRKKLLTLLAAMDAADVDQFFAYPVPEDTPGYFEIVKQPMDLSTARDKVKDRRYSCLEELVGDMHLMLDNCELYNDDASDLGAAARHLREVLEETVAELQ